MSPHIIKAASGVNGHQQTQTDTPRHPWTMSGWKTHNFGTTQEGGNYFHLALLGYQNIKTSLHFLPKNHWGRPFVAIFSSVREKLQFTVSLNHPVPQIIGIFITDIGAFCVNSSTRLSRLSQIMTIKDICHFFAHIVDQIFQKYALHWVPVDFLWS